MLVRRLAANHAIDDAPQKGLVAARGLDRARLPRLRVIVPFDCVERRRYAFHLVRSMSAIALRNSSAAILIAA